MKSVNISFTVTQPDDLLTGMVDAWVKCRKNFFDDEGLTDPSQKPVSQMSDDEKLIGALAFICRTACEQDLDRIMELVEDLVDNLAEAAGLEDDDGTPKGKRPKLNVFKVMPADLPGLLAKIAAAEAAGEDTVDMDGTPMPLALMKGVVEGARAHFKEQGTLPEAAEEEAAPTLH